MLTKLVVILVLTVPSLLGMGIAAMIGVRQWWVHLIVSVLAAVATGVFIASAASAMATASDPSDARLRGVLIGTSIGVVMWAAVFGLIALIRVSNASNS